MSAKCQVHLTVDSFFSSTILSAFDSKPFIKIFFKKQNQAKDRKINWHLGDFFPNTKKSNHILFPIVIAFISFLYSFLEQTLRSSCTPGIWIGSGGRLSTNVKDFTDPMRKRQVNSPIVFMIHFQTCRDNLQHQRRLRINLSRRIAMKMCLVNFSYSENKFYC